MRPSFSSSLKVEKGANLHHQKSPGWVNNIYYLELVGKCAGKTYICIMLNAYYIELLCSMYYSVISLIIVKFTYAYHSENPKAQENLRAGSQRVEILILHTA